MKKILIAILFLGCIFFTFHKALAISEETMPGSISWKKLAVFLVLLALCFAGYMLWRYFRKKKYGGIGWVEYEVEEGDNINDLAQKFWVDWKVLTKTNKLKAPYILEIGQTILVPPAADSSAAAIDGGSIEADWAKTNIVEADGNEEEVVAEEMKKKPPRKNAKSKTKNIASEKRYVVDEISMKNEETIIKADAKSDREKSDIYKKIIIILLLLIFLVGLIGISSFSFSLYLKAKNELSDNSKLSISSIEKIPSAEEKINKEPENASSQLESEIKAEDTTKTESKKPADISVKILNGGSIAGSAGAVKSILIGKGYSKTEAQNASKDSYQGVVVYYGDNLESEAKTLQETLKDKYPKAEIKPASTDEEKAAEIVVILGK